MKISELNADIEILQNQINEKNNLEVKISDFVNSVSTDGFDYLAIGNSITIHSPCEYWPGYWGMAASTEDNDYFHIVSDRIEDKYGENIKSIAFSYCAWETQSADRSETWYMIDPLLVKGMDLVTVQLSENCDNLNTFETDYRNLLTHIREKCGKNAMIIVIDDFWDDYKSGILRSIVDDLDDNNLFFVDLSDIRNQEEYRCGIGTVIYDDEGLENPVDHYGVSIHPGDAGMLVISERILEYT